MLDSCNQTSDFSGPNIELGERGGRPCPVKIRAPTHSGLATPLFVCVCCRVYDGLVLRGEQLIIPAGERPAILDKRHQAHASSEHYEGPEKSSSGLEWARR